MKISLNNVCNVSVYVNIAFRGPTFTKQFRCSWIVDDEVLIG